MEENENILETIIKVEPEEFQAIEVNSDATASVDGVVKSEMDSISEAGLVEQIRIRSSNSKQHQETSEEAKNLCNQGNEGLLPKDPHTCCVCLKVLSNRNGLMRHLEAVHVRSETFRCTFCPKFYFDKYALKHHMKNHGQKSFECKVCDYKTAIELRFEEHELTHAAKVECPICNKPVSLLKQHMRSHKAKVACPICLKMMSSYYLSNHLETHTERKNYFCKKCSEGFESKLNLKRHNLRSHYDGVLFACHCGAVFKSERYLKIHQQIHDVASTTCEVCQKEFSSITYYRRHWKEKHEQTHGMLEINKMRLLKRNGSYICDICGSKSSTRVLFRVHIRKKHRTLFCDLCPRSFFQKNILIDHMKGVHLNLRPFDCKVCSHRSFSKDDLKKHVKAHGPKTQCKVCHKFVANVYNHSRSHIEVKCAICSKVYSKSTITKHVKTHARGGNISKKKQAKPVEIYI